MRDKPASPPFYTIEPYVKPEGSFMATAAIRSCCVCGAIVDGMGGPGSGYLCPPCTTDLVTGRLRKFLDVRGMIAARPKPGVQG